MDTFGILGFVIGLVAFVFAILAWNQVAGLKKEVENLRAELRRERTTPA